MLCKTAEKLFEENPNGHTVYIYRTSPRKPPASAGGVKGDQFPEIKFYL